MIAAYIMEIKKMEKIVGIRNSPRFIAKIQQRRGFRCLQGRFTIPACGLQPFSTWHAKNLVVTIAARLPIEIWDRPLSGLVTTCNPWILWNRPLNED